MQMVTKDVIQINLLIIQKMLNQSFKIEKPISKIIKVTNSIYEHESWKNERIEKALQNALQDF